MKRLLLLATLSMTVACGGVTTPGPTPAETIDRPRLNSPAIAITPQLSPTVCPSSQNPIRKPPQALPPSAGACPP